MLERKNIMPKKRRAKAKEMRRKFKTPQAISGQKGGLRGGPNRASKLSKNQRKKIATQGAAARWSGRR